MLWRTLKRALVGRPARPNAAGGETPRAVRTEEERREADRQKAERQAVRRANLAERRAKVASWQSRNDGPDFICIGMQKAGTIWLYDQIGNHPDIWQPPVKELHVLNAKPTQRSLSSLLRRHAEDAEHYNEMRADKGRRAVDEADVDFVRKLSAMIDKQPDLERYAELFAAKGERLSGDVTPGYSSLKRHVITQVVERFPNARFILLLREPVDRAWSYVAMNVRREELGRKAGVRADEWAAIAAMLAEPSAAIRSKPSSIVRRWQPFVGDRLGVFFFDDLRDDAAGLRRRVAEFIGVDPDRFGPLPAEHNRKASKPKVAMPDDIREKLVAHFADEIRTSAEELGGRALEWPGRYGL